MHVNPRSFHFRIDSGCTSRACSLTAFRPFSRRGKRRAVSAVVSLVSKGPDDSGGNGLLRIACGTVQWLERRSIVAASRRRLLRPVSRDKFLLGFENAPANFSLPFLFALALHSPCIASLSTILVYVHMYVYVYYSWRELFDEISDDMLINFFLWIEILYLWTSRKSPIKHIPIFVRQILILLLSLTTLWIPRKITSQVPSFICNKFSPQDGNSIYSIKQTRLYERFPRLQRPNARKSIDPANGPDTRCKDPSGTVPSGTGQVKRIEERAIG